MACFSPAVIIIMRVCRQRRRMLAPSIAAQPGLGSLSNPFRHQSLCHDLRPSARPPIRCFRLDHSRRWSTDAGHSLVSTIWLSIRSTCAGQSKDFDRPLDGSHVYTLLAADEMLKSAFRPVDSSASSRITCRMEWDNKKGGFFFFIFVFFLISWPTVSACVGNGDEIAICGLSGSRSPVEIASHFVDVALTAVLRNSKRKQRLAGSMILDWRDPSP